MFMLFVDETELPPVGLSCTPDPATPTRLLATAAKVSKRLTAVTSVLVRFGSLALILDVEDFSEEEGCTSP